MRCRIGCKRESEGSTLLKQLDPQTADDICDSGSPSPMGRLVTGIANRKDGDLIADVSEVWTKNPRSSSSSSPRFDR